MKNLGKYLAIGAASLALANPLSAQERNLEVRTRVCDIGGEDLPVAVIADGEEPLYAIANSSELGLEPVVVPWENPTGTRITTGRGDVNFRDSVAVEIPCRWADENESVSWVRGFIPSDNISLRGDSVYIQMDGQQFQYALPERN